jgi:hypothetical protein
MTMIEDVRKAVERFRAIAETLNDAGDSEIIHRYASEVEKDSRASQSMGARGAIRILISDPMEVFSKMKEAFASDREALLEAIDLVPDEWGQVPPVSRSGTSASAELADFVGRLEFERRIRNTHFNRSGLQSEREWDILLDVAAAEAKPKLLAVSSICIGACVPAKIAMEWVAALRALDLVYLQGEGSDARQSFLRLTPLGRASTAGCLSELKGFGSDRNQPQCQQTLRINSPRAARLPQAEQSRPGMHAAPGVPNVRGRASL